MSDLAFISPWGWGWELVTALSTVALTVATGVLAYGVPMELKRARRDERYLFYAQLDRTYFEIQKLLMEKPYLANHTMKRTREQEHEYDAFAFIVWNFLESIFDYSEQDKFLLETWDCIFKYEARRHLEWFRREENHEKFKERFRKHVAQEISI